MLIFLVTLEQENRGLRRLRHLPKVELDQNDGDGIWIQTSDTKSVLLTTVDNDDI